MAREQISPAIIERRCPNCGTRIARDAESCFMCGHDLRLSSRRTRGVSLVDALLVLAVVSVLVLWWQMGSRSTPVTNEVVGQGILPGNVPLLDLTGTPTPQPEPTVTPTTAPATSTVRHQVITGETLLAIAAQYGVSVADIQAANNLSNELIRAGDVLLVPVIGPAAETSLNRTPASQFQYTVQTGDTIISIAVNFGSTVEDILAVNNRAANDIIRPGDVLIIPLRQTPTEVIESAAPAAQSPANTTDQSAAIASVYVEPRLIGPANEVTVWRDEAVLFRWISVDVLAPNEWYVLLLYPDSNSTAQSLPSIWTKATSYRLAPEFAPKVGETASYVWRVSVARVETGANGQMILEAASPPSEVRRFTWQ
ncbi:MAG: LysM peptidoglycan-binding domain-containing protein [Caldilineaceae bacterium]|nr:LysM peptidoglycan-binding domain-containing protein [Caldilineaceae bacterium]